MLSNGGVLNGKRLLSPKTVELMSSVHAPDTLQGQPPGRSFGLSVQVVNNAVVANFRVSDGSYGWDGAFGTQLLGGPEGEAGRRLPDAAPPRFGPRSSG